MIELVEHERIGAKLSDDDKGELLRSFRALSDKVQDLYRPIRDSLSAEAQLSDPDLLGLCRARDNLIAAENAVLGIREARNAKQAADGERGGRHGG
ncbi:hypothetical protein [Sphingomonas sp. BK481]|uniref:hypothetical protein n=1 Tax=Sphingomonas sp. BK481 TaxID=2586981 RepID=UPI0016148F40|nr:hypothetical protein [Sphingomonas sp. BK481]MBB3588984.1 hypothetical protein [Sphingomonas sp. BK481]